MKIGRKRQLKTIYSKIILAKSLSSSELKAEAGQFLGRGPVISSVFLPVGQFLVGFCCNQELSAFQEKSTILIFTSNLSSRSF